MERLILYERSRQALKKFYQKMNEKSREIKLSDKTHWHVAHGMHHDYNYSTALDVASLSFQAMKHTEFCQVVNTKRYDCVTKLRTYKWVNTNNLLWDPSHQFKGIKTGITQTAGPCLAVNFVSKEQNFDFIVVILNCKSREARFLEV